jgi:hypothetical protein
MAATMSDPEPYLELYLAGKCILGLVVFSLVVNVGYWALCKGLHWLSMKGW